jgi:hypothetical protein
MAALTAVSDHILEQSIAVNIREAIARAKTIRMHVLLLLK